MGKQVIAVDIDDVLAVSVEAWVAYSNQKWGTHLSADDYDEDWVKMWKVDQTELERRAQHFYTSGLVKTYNPREKAKEVLGELAQRYRLVVTSARASDVRQDTLDWIDRHFGGVFEEIYLAGFYDNRERKDTHMLTKADLLTSVGANYLIDDQPKHCFAAASIGIPALLFGSYAWNRNIGALPSGVTRAADWLAVREYFKGLQRGA
ncbi:MAG TPA: hypothetical protein VF261_01695 [Candidatus Saccharimonadales bacterium]